MSTSDPTSSSKKEMEAEEEQAAGEPSASEEVEHPVHNHNEKRHRRVVHYKEEDKKKWDLSLANIRHMSGDIVNDHHVQLVVVMLISVNALMMGVGTFDAVKKDEAIDRIFERVDLVFLIIFTLELFLQFIYRGMKLLLDGWLVFDLIIITFSWAFSSIQIIRAFRIFRAFRLITRVQIMKDLVGALFSAMPRVGAIVCLSFLVSYIYAVMFTQLFRESNDEFFGRLDVSLFSLFQISTLDNWADIARDVMVEETWAWFPFMTYVIIQAFVMFNLLVAVICDSLAALESDEKAKLYGSHAKTLKQELEHREDLDVREQLDILEMHLQDLTLAQETAVTRIHSLTLQVQAFRRQQHELLQFHKQAGTEELYIEEEC